MADPRTVIVAMTITRRDTLRAHIAAASAAGRRITVVSGYREPWEPLPPGTEAFELARLLPRRRWHRVATILTSGPPYALHRSLQLLFGALATRAPRPLRPAMDKRSRAHRRSAGRARAAPTFVTRRLGGPLGHYVRPWIMWRTFRRHAPLLAAGDEIVWGDQPSWPIVWHLARRSPGVVVRSFQEVAAAFPEAPAPEPLA